MGQNATEFALANYSLPALLRSLDELYSGLLAKKSARGAAVYATNP